jgi:7-cyano-7-deazaguanine synthase in queuosine biosynthesis
MTWQVVTRIGPDDNHCLGLAGDAARMWVAIDRPGDPWAVGHNLRLFADAELSLTPEARDILHFAISVYAADLTIPRRLSSDRWGRQIVLHLPVTDVETWSRALEVGIPALEFLTGDSWSVELRPRSGGKTATRKPPKKLSDVDAVALFSGGLDSLVGAIDLLASGNKVALVGHHGQGITNSVQADVLAELRAHFAGRFEPFLFYVQPPKPVRGFRETAGKIKKISDGEQTMRSRSLLFLSLGAVTANALQATVPLIVAENGFISLNVPLTITRLGSASTRTTHPHFVSMYAEFLARLGMPTTIQMPYSFQTKGEMLVATKNQAALAAACPRSMSCSHPEQGRFAGASLKSHCGYCVPCIIRRAATAAAGTADGPYRTDLTDSKQRPRAETDSGSDLRAFEMAYLRCKARGPRDAALDVLSSGPLPPEDVARYADVYVRGLAEVGRFLGLGKGL